MRHADTQTDPVDPGAAVTRGYATTNVAVVRFHEPVRDVTPPDAADVIRRHFAVAAPRRGDGRTGHAFGPMVVRAVEELDLTRPPDLLVVAHSLHDVAFDTLAALQAAHVLGVRHSGSFAVTDRGVLSGFTAVRLATALGVREGYERVVVTVVEQDRLPYDDRLRRAAGAVSGTAVALLLDATCGPAVRVRGRPWPAGAGSEGPVVSAARDACADLEGPAHVVLGATVPADWVRSLAPAARVTRARPDGLPATAVWEALAGTDTGALPTAGARFGGGALVVERDARHGGIEVALLPRA